MTDTIFALSTPPGRAGVAVVRVSGPASKQVLESLIAKPCPKPRHAVLRELTSPQDGDVLDRALVLWFPAPRSFTGEDVAEFHLHGGAAVIAGVLETLNGLHGAQPAEPGAFTRRAFDNGKLDLTEVEGLADLIDAETRAQRRAAMRQMSGALGDLYERWRAILLNALAHVEAAIDFSEEELPPDLLETALTPLRQMPDEVRRHLDDDGRGERLRAGFHIAIVGEPNVGKSSLLNAMAQRDVAIVSSLPGTTRDIVEVHLDLKGFPATLFDTAGLRTSDDPIEAEGIRRARQRASQADLRILVVDARDPKISPDVGDLLGEGDLVVANKCDLLGSADYVALSPVGASELLTFVPKLLSAKRGDGIDGLIDHLTELVSKRLAGGDSVFLTRARHRTALEETAEAIERSLQGRMETPELLCEDLRIAARSLGRITGRVDVEDLLDVIFADFCIGK